VNPAIKITVLSILAAILLGAMLLGPGLGNKPSLVLFCAVALKPPIEAAAREYEAISGVPIQIQYGGSGALLSNLRVVSEGDLFLPADETYITQAHDLGLVQEFIPLARMKPVIAVRHGNPKRIESVTDLLREDVSFALADPDVASIGRTTRDILLENGMWDEIRKKAKVLKPTVGDVANDIKIGTVDAGILWDVVAAQYSEMAVIHDTRFAEKEQTVSIAVLTTSRRPDEAKRFARYLASEKGRGHFLRFGYAL